MKAESKAEEVVRAWAFEKRPDVESVWFKTVTEVVGALAPSAAQKKILDRYRKRLSAAWDKHNKRLAVLRERAEKAMHDLKLPTPTGSPE